MLVLFGALAFQLGTALVGALGLFEPSAPVDPLDF